MKRGIMLVVGVIVLLVLADTVNELRKPWPRKSSLAYWLWDARFALSEATRKPNSPALQAELDRELVER